MAKNLPGVEVARMTGYTTVQISRLRRRFAAQGLAGIEDEPRSERPPVITPRKRAQIVTRTLRPPGSGLSHWSARELATEVGVSHSTVHRSCAISVACAPILLLAYTVMSRNL
jgi:transposase